MHYSLSYACENVNKLLVGNKMDLADKRAVTWEEAKVTNTLHLLAHKPRH